MAELLDYVGKIDKAIMTTGEKSDVSIVLHGPDEVSSLKCRNAPPESHQRRGAFHFAQSLQLNPGNRESTFVVRWQDRLHVRHPHCVGGGSPGLTFGCVRRYKPTRLIRSRRRRDLDPQRVSRCRARALLDA